MHCLRTCTRSRLTQPCLLGVGLSQPTINVIFAGFGAHGLLGLVGWGGPTYSLENRRVGGCTCRAAAAASLCNGAACWRLASDRCLCAVLREGGVWAVLRCANVCCCAMQDVALRPKGFPSSWINPFTSPFTFLGIDPSWGEWYATAGRQWMSNVAHDGWCGNAACDWDWPLTHAAAALRTCRLHQEE